MKFFRSWFFIPLFFLVNFGSTAYSKDSAVLVGQENYCPFCDPAVLARQTFYQDDLVLALYTHKPIYPGHCLVIPKRHVERFEELSLEEMTQIGVVLEKVNHAVSSVFGTSAYLILQKNGQEVGQTVPHVHFHYIPRMKGDDSTITFLFRMFFINWLGPVSQEELDEKIFILKRAMEEQDSLDASA